MVAPGNETLNLDLRTGRLLIPGQFPLRNKNILHFRKSQR